MSADGDDVDKVIYRMAKRWTDVLVTLNTSGISIDAAFSGNSENPLQNKVITQKITEILQALNSINDLAKAELPTDGKYYVVKDGVLVEMPEGDGGIYMRIDNGYIQWSNNNEDWNNLITVEEITGPSGQDGVDGDDGREIELQATESYIQWRYVGDESWNNLITIESLRGEKGEPGLGVPEGGDTGKVLKKKSPADYDTEWGEATGGHTILDKSSTPQTQRTNLKFEQEVEDDAVNDITLVKSKFKTISSTVEYDNGNSGAAKTIDFNNGKRQKLTLTDNCTLTFTAVAGSNLTFTTLLKIIQDGTGNWNLTFPVGTEFPNGAFTFLAGTANQKCLLGIAFNGTTYEVVPSNYY